MAAPYTLWAFWILLDEQNRVLLVLRNDTPFWNLPWWGLESWETPREAAVREIKEETGLEAEVERLLGIYAKEYKDDIVFLFLCKKVWGSLVLNDEAQAFERYEKDKLPENIFQNHKVRILDFFSQSSGTVTLKKHSQLLKR